jgi:hypothetical protein
MSHGVVFGCYVYINVHISSSAKRKKISKTDLAIWLINEYM